MLAFSRQSTDQKTDCHMDQLLDATLTLSENDYNLKKKFDFREIEITRDYAENLPQVHCDENLIQQVFFNILRNGAEAMADDDAKKGNHRFWLRTKTVGEYIQVEIEDNGPGMDDRVQKRIFEPFFTTKAVGVGTGLGLSVSYFIITENHGGNIWVESSPGIGTKFIIQLPAAQA